MVIETKTVGDGAGRGGAVDMMLKLYRFFGEQQLSLQEALLMTYWGGGGLRGWTRGQTTQDVMNVMEEGGRRGGSQARARVICLAHRKDWKATKR